MLRQRIRIIFYQLTQ